MISEDKMAKDKVRVKYTYDKDILMEEWTSALTNKTDWNAFLGKVEKRMGALKANKPTTGPKPTLNIATLRQKMYQIRKRQQKDLDGRCLPMVGATKYNVKAHFNANKSLYK